MANDSETNKKVCILFKFYFRYKPTSNKCTISNLIWDC